MMGRFIVSRSVAGDRFTLQSASGHTLAVSRDYATLDACKKGILSLIKNAPTVPIRDLTAGERGANPKFEITGSEGAFLFALKSANGKAVITSVPYATKKACLRAIAMLRTGVADHEILFERKGEYIPLMMKALPKATPVKKEKVSNDISVEAMPPKETVLTMPQAASPAAEKPHRESEQPTAGAAPEHATLVDEPSPVETPTVFTPRVVRVKPAPTTLPKTAEEPAPAVKKPALSPRPTERVAPPPKKRGFFERLFKK